MTDVVGTPIFSDAVPYYNVIIANAPYRTFIDGHGADSAFGSNLRHVRMFSWVRWPGVSTGIKKAGDILPGSLGRRARYAGGVAVSLSKDPLDPDGRGGHTRTFGDVSLYESIVGEEALRQQRREQLDFLLERVDLEATDEGPFLAHTEIVQWMVTLAGAVMRDRMMAQARGALISGPYGDWRVLNELARVPVTERYITGLRAKWLLKELLLERVPDYPVDQRKKATALPWRRFYEQGPLKDIWDRYDVPDLFQGADRDQLINNPTITTWNAITYAVWEERIAKNPDLKPFPAVEELSITFG